MCQLIKRSEILYNLLLIRIKILFVAVHFVVREHPDVRVRHFVSDDAAEDEVSIKSLSLRLRYLSCHFEVCACVRNIPDPAVVLLRDHLDMPWRLGMNIEKCEEICVLVYDLSRDFFRDNFAEDAI